MAPIFFQTFPEKPSAAIFLSGTGTNAAKLLEGWQSGKYSGWTPRVLVTDKPETSRARSLAAEQCSCQCRRTYLTELVFSCLCRCIFFAHSIKHIDSLVKFLCAILFVNSGINSHFNGFGYRVFNSGISGAFTHIKKSATYTAYAWNFIKES